MIEGDDIVDRLRKRKSSCWPSLMDEAVEEIRRLRESVAQAIQDSDERTKTHTDGSPNAEALMLECNRLAERLVAMRAERDHARRLHCYDVAATIQGRTAEDVAKRLEWDCFKEERCSTG